MSSSEEAKYINFLEMETYTTPKRYERPKENFKAAMRKLLSLRDASKPLTLVDQCCANGEFLYYAKTQAPGWQLFGFDIEPKFIEVGNAYEGLKGVTLAIGNMFEQEAQYDVVTCFGSMPVFPDVERPLSQLLKLCKKGGVVIADGLFNRYDVEVQIVYQDNSVKVTEGIWQRDFNHHSRRRINEFLKGKVESVEFEDIVMGVDLPYDPNKPQSHVWTFKDEGGRNLIVNGMNMILNSTLMTIRT